MGGLCRLLCSLLLCEIDTLLFVKCVVTKYMPRQDGLPVGWTVDRESDTSWSYQSSDGESSVEVEFVDSANVFRVTGRGFSVDVDSRLDAFETAYEIARDEYTEEEDE